jgi:CO dehydrogenase/acetyl-CoA synthase beta subunit
MARLLTISRVSVAPEHEAEYVRTVHLLAELAQGRSQRLWLFRSTNAPSSYVEFSEGKSELGHRARASRTDLEEKLERRLREIAEYAPGAWDMWEEVPVPELQDLSEG